MADSDDEDKTVCRRPKDTKFKQQKLPAWQPVMTATNVLPFMFAIGVAFIPLGVAFLITSNNVQELMVDYTHCKRNINDSETCAQILANNTQANCICNVTFTLPTKFVGPVYVYYSLTNFYQNHRRYVKSRDDYQLLGQSLNYNFTSDCNGPYKGQKETFTMYAPCGAIANSLFNDTLEIFSDRGLVELNDTGIAWTTDRYKKFRNPEGFSKDPAGVFNNTLKPPYWQKPVYELDEKHPDNNGYQNEALMVWMRTAALPTFRKLYSRVVADGGSQDLEPGNYTLQINYNYPTVQFNGAKRMIITTMSWLGGKNPFLGIAYLVVGSFCIAIGFVFLIIHLKVGKSSSDLHNIPLTPRTMYYDSCYAAGSATSNSHPH